MGNVTKTIFEVETIEAGQRRKYGDSYYHYVVKSEISPHIIKKYCLHVLQPAIPPDQPPGTGDGFQPYCTMLKVLKEVDFFEGGLNVVEYKVTQPNTF